MELYTLLQQYLTEIVSALAVCSIVVEVTPVKLNPWTFIFKAVGKRMNGDIVNRLDVVEAQLKEQDAKIDSNEKDRIKYEILDFVRSCRKKEVHTKEEFDHILEQYDKYEVILAKLEQPNGKVTQAMKFINSLYLEIHEQDNFSA